MLLTVQEASYITNIKLFHIYYLLKMSKIDGAVKILDCWRIDEKSLGEIYDRSNAGRNAEIAADTGPEGLKKRLEIVREKYIQDSERPFSPGLQGGRGMVRQQRRSDKLAGPRVKQFELWTEGNYW